MNLDIHFLTLMLGILLTTFGVSVLFSDKFFSFMKKRLWIGVEQDKRNWSPEGRRNFNKYGRGLGSLLGGIVLLIFSLLYYL